MVFWSDGQVIDLQLPITQLRRYSLHVVAPIHCVHIALTTAQYYIAILALGLSVLTHKNRTHPNSSLIDISRLLWRICVTHGYTFRALANFCARTAHITYDAFKYKGRSWVAKLPFPATLTRGSTRCRRRAYKYNTKHLRAYHVNPPPCKRIHLHNEK
jgi:hypothetical protein